MLLKLSDESLFDLLEDQITTGKDLIYYYTYVIIFNIFIYFYTLLMIND